jgi:hypothetical protein
MYTSSHITLFSVELVVKRMKSHSCESEAVDRERYLMIIRKVSIATDIDIGDTAS